MKKIITLFLFITTIFTACGCSKSSTPQLTHTSAPTVSPGPTENIPIVKVTSDTLIQNFFTDCNDIIQPPTESNIYKHEDSASYYLDFKDEKYGESITLTVFYTQDEKLITAVNINIGFDTPVKMYEASRKDPEFAYNKIFNSIIKSIAPEYDMTKLLFNDNNMAFTDKFFINLSDVNGSLFASFILEED